MKGGGGGDLLPHVFIRGPETDAARFFGQQLRINELVERLLSQIHLLGEFWRKTLFIDFPVVGLDIPIGTLKFLKSDGLIIDRDDDLHLCVFSETSNTKEHEDQRNNQKERFDPD